MGSDLAPGHPAANFAVAVVAAVVAVVVAAARLAAARLAAARLAAAHLAAARLAAVRLAVVAHPIGPLVAVLSLLQLSEQLSSLLAHASCSTSNLPQQELLQLEYQ